MLTKFRFKCVTMQNMQILMKKFCQNCGICGKFITFASDKR